MQVTKIKPVGLDFYIQQLQGLLNKKLLAAWGISDDQYACYGRAYRNKKDNGYIAEVYTGNDEYKEVYWDDKLSALSFFGISNNIKYDVGSSADVHLVFFVDIEKLKPGIAHRADNEVRLDVEKLVTPSYYGFEYISTDLWIENVLREYAGSYRDQRLKAVDMHPVHCFRINLKLLYDSQTYC